MRRSKANRTGITPSQNRIVHSAMLNLTVQRAGPALLYSKLLIVSGLSSKTA
jgi:hypothetical protein